MPGPGTIRLVLISIDYFGPVPRPYAGAFFLNTDDRTAVYALGPGVIWGLSTL
jgi:hypothetical protein